MKRFSWWAFIICVSLSGLVVLTFGYGAGFEFITFDDPSWVTENAGVQAGLSLEGIRYAFGTPILLNWVPLTLLSHMAVCQFFGSNPVAHHAVNIALHAVSVVLIFLMLHNLTGTLWRSAAVAAFFAVSPLRAESVMWVTERKDVLSGVLFLLACMAYVAWARRKGALRYLLVLLLVACGLMAKSMLVTLPCVLLLLDYWPLGRFRDGRSVGVCFLEKLPMFAMAAATAVLQVRLAAPFLVSVETVSPWARLTNALVTYAVYARQIFWPGELAAFYPNPGVPPAWEIFASVEALALISAGVWFFGRNERALRVGWLWFVGMLVPVIGILQGGELGRADRYTYLPHIGLLILCVWGISAVIRRLQLPSWVVGMMSAVALLASVRAGRLQAATWRSEELLWRHALAVTRNNHYAEMQLGLVELQRNHLPEALAHLRAAARIQPRSWRARANLATALLAHGENEAAIQEASAAMEMNAPETAAVLGKEFKAAGMLSAAAVCFEKALATHPDSIDLELELAFLRTQTGAIEAAEASYRHVLSRSPDNLRALVELGQLLALNRRPAEGASMLEKALSKSPGDAFILDALASARRMQGQAPDGKGFDKE